MRDESSGPPSCVGTVEETGPPSPSPVGCEVLGCLTPEPKRVVLDPFRSGAEVMGDGGRVRVTRGSTQVRCEG